jgi:hypothetical protein
MALAIAMNCYNGEQGIVRVRVHKNFDLLSFRDLYSGHAVASSKRGHRLPRSLRSLKFFEGEADVKTSEGEGEVYLYGQIRRHGRARLPPDQNPQRRVRKVLLRRPRLAGAPRRARGLSPGLSRIP